MSAIALVGVMLLAEWTPPGGHTETAFRLGAGGQKYQIWGGRDSASRFYLNEWLPALFERTLVLDEIDLHGGVLEWIFTGDRGGFTILTDPKHVTLTQRFYDSFGFNDAKDGKVQSPRHPERTWRQTSASYEGRVRGLTVNLDHKLGLTVRVNGTEILRQDCEIDVSRHQLRLTGDGSAAAGRILSPPVVDAVVRIDPAERHQTMIGFGGIATPTAYAQLSPAGKRRWWQLVREYNLLIQREYPIGTRLNTEMTNWDHLSDATPHYYGDNFPNGEISDFDYIAILRRLGGKVFFEFWDLPPWARQDWTDAKGKVHKGVADPEAYAKAMVNYCLTSKRRCGAPPDIVGIQNEKTQPAEIWHAMTLSLRGALNQAGLSSVRIHMSDHGNLRGGIERARAFKASSQTWSAIDYAATHMYDYQGCFTDPDRYDALLRAWRDLTKDKPFLSTELCINSGRYQQSSYRLALTMGQLYHKNLTLADAAAICYCWTLLNVVQPSYGATRSLCVPDRSDGMVPVASSYQLRVFGAYSRRVKEGMIRVGTASDDPDVLAAAFAGTPSAQTVILLNRSTSPRRVRLQAADWRLTQSEVVDPYDQNAIRAAPHPRERGSYDVTVAPGAVVTLSNVPLGAAPRDLDVEVR